MYSNLESLVNDNNESACKKGHFAQKKLKNVNTIQFKNFDGSYLTCARNVVLNSCNFCSLSKYFYIAQKLFSVPSGPFLEVYSHN